MIDTVFTRLSPDNLTGDLLSGSMSRPVFAQLGNGPRDNLRPFGRAGSVMPPCNK